MFILWTVTVLPLPRFDAVLEMIWGFRRVKLLAVCRRSCAKFVLHGGRVFH